jgi:hypothetical protein
MQHGNRASPYTPSHQQYTHKRIADEDQGSSIYLPKSATDRGNDGHDDDNLLPQ